MSYRGQTSVLYNKFQFFFGVKTVTVLRTYVICLNVKQLFLEPNGFRMELSGYTFLTALVFCSVIPEIPFDLFQGTIAWWEHMGSGGLFTS